MRNKTFAVFLFEERHWFVLSVTLSFPTVDPRRTPKLPFLIQFAIVVFAIWIVFVCSRIQLVTLISNNSIHTTETVVSTPMVVMFIIVSSSIFGIFIFFKFLIRHSRIKFPFRDFSYHNHECIKATQFSFQLALSEPGGAVESDFICGGKKRLNI